MRKWMILSVLAVAAVGVIGCETNGDRATYRETEYRPDGSIEQTERREIQRRDGRTEVRVEERVEDR